ncbi:MAG: DNA modification methylase [Rhizobiales bacterium]|nr:DNA modification methylase [Hyphomicrobiales bacterium]
MNITYLDLDAVRPYEKAARVHNRAKLRKLRKLIERFGQVVPIIVDPDHVIIDGHAIHAVLREMGEEQIAAVVATGRSDPELRALRLALNRIPQDSAWDKERLEKEFSALVALSFDMELTEDPADIPLPSSKPVTQLGDVWLCGPHRIACGDALDRAALASLLGGEQPIMAFCDPPYNIPVDGFISGLGQVRHREFVQGSGELSPEQYLAFLVGALDALKRSVAEAGVLFVCMDWRHLFDLLSAARSCELELINLCVWAKTNAGMGSLYRSQHELVAVFRAGSAPHLNNVELGRHGRSRSNLWTYRGLNSFGADRDDLLAAHPTVKPVAMIADAIRDVTRRKQAVLDLFLGSGSTLIAAEETGRRCFGMELDPIYVDVCIRRWQQHTGRDAVHAASGSIFAEVAERRDPAAEVHHGP